MKNEITKENKLKIKPESKIDYFLLGKMCSKFPYKATFIQAPEMDREIDFIEICMSTVLSHLSDAIKL